MMNKDQNILPFKYLCMAVIAVYMDDHKVFKYRIIQESGSFTYKIILENNILLLDSKNFIISPPIQDRYTTEMVQWLDPSPRLRTRIIGTCKMI